MICDVLSGVRCRPVIIITFRGETNAIDVKPPDLPVMAMARCHLKLLTVLAAVVAEEEEAVVEWVAVEEDRGETEEDLEVTEVVEEAEIAVVLEEEEEAEAVEWVAQEVAVE